MKQYKYGELTPDSLKKLVQRPKIDFPSIFDTVQPIIDSVKDKGDEALREYTRKFDGIIPDRMVLDPSGLEVSLGKEIKEAIDLAFDNIYRFHRAQRRLKITVETIPGVICSRKMVPIQSVGLYVPGGTAILPSSAMMLAIPAMIAECPNIVLATPPDSDGKVADEIIYIAKKAKVSSILIAGGAQAIAAMAIGTQTVPKVDKIFGPGNQYVTAAKMLLQNSDAMISIDMPAGPSEVLVVADETANPSFVAADLLSQAEHGTDSQVVLVCTPDFNIDNLDQELTKQVNLLPRKETAQKALNNSFILKVENMNQAFSFSNEYAPEHLILNLKDAESFEDQIINAGSVFLGNLTPESVGDYASGTNHTLPTYGYAKTYSGVSLDSFYKSITMQTITEEGLKSIGPTVEILADVEGLQAHKNAVTLRLKEINRLS